MQTKRSWIQTAARWLTLAVVFCLIVPNFGPGATRVAHAQPAAPPIMSEAQIGPDSMFGDYSTTPPTLPAELTPATVHAADVATQVGDTYTWTQDARADWEQGTLENLDSAAVSGTLQLAQRYFSTNETILPKAELAAVQQNPTIAVDVQGNAYAVWQDQRADDYDIYFAYRPTGGVWEDNEKVNDDAGIAGQSAPAIAVDGQGNAYAIWTDGRNGNSDIYFAYRPAGGVWGVNVKVNDDVGIATQGTPGIAVDTQGNAYAIWTDARNGNNDIYFAYHPAEGMWGANLKINDDTGSANQSGRAIDVDDSGNAYALWTDQRNGNLDVYFATRPSSGEWEPNAKVNDGMGATGLTSSAPDIAVDGQGNAYAIWLGVGAGDDIYASYRPVDGTWSASVKINDDTFSQQAWPAITVDENGNAYAVWWDHRNGMDVYFATHPVGGTWGDNIEIGDISSYAWWGFCDVATDGNNNAYIVWADNRNDNPDIYFATCTETGVCEANAKINDDPGIAGQNNPVIAVDSSDNIYALWEDERNGNADIYFSYRFEDGAWNASVKVNDDSGTMGQSGPALAVDAASNLYAVWRDWRETQTYIIDDVYFATRPFNGSWSTNENVNEVSSLPPQSGGAPAIAVDDAGNAYALWADASDGNIYFSYRPVGGAWDANVKVNTTGTAGSPSIDVDPQGNAYAIWDYGDDIYFALRPAGGAWGSQSKVNDSGSGGMAGAPAIAVDDTGNAYAIWYDYRNGNFDIYFAYRATGETWSANTKVNDDIDTAGQGVPAIAVDGAGNAYAVWQDYRNNSNSDIYLAYRPANGVWETNVKVDDDTGTASQSNPAVAVNSAGQAHIAWRDNRNSVATLYFATYPFEAAYHMNGTYTSPELDAGVSAAIWNDLAYSATLPAGTALTFEIRTRITGGVWSSWQPTTGDIASPSGQYLQYRVTFTTPATDTTPILDWVKINYTSVGTPSAPRFVTPCGVTNQLTPTLTGSAAAGSVIQLYVDGVTVLTTTTGANGTFALRSGLSAGSHVVTATAANAQGAGPASAPLVLTVNPALSYNPLAVRAGQWSKDGWLLSPPRDAQGCANPAGWQVWPRANEKFMVQVPVSYTTAAAVTVTIGTQTITLTEGTGKVFAGVFQPPLTAGAFTIIVNADGHTTTVNGGPVLIDPDGFVYEASKTISDTIPGVQVTCYYSNTHSGQWLLWDAWNYDAQANPQTTLDDGYYSFYTPAGTYRVVAEKEGYPTYTSPDLVVVSTPVRHNIPLGVTTVCTTPLTGVGIVGPLGVTNSLYIGTQYTFQSVITPANATAPITYTWTPAPGSGQGDSTATYRWTTPGLYTITLMAENCGGPVTATRQITLYDKEQNAIYLPLVLRNF